MKRIIQIAKNKASFNRGRAFIYNMKEANIAENKQYLYADMKLREIVDQSDFSKDPYETLENYQNRANEVKFSQSPKRCEVLRQKRKENSRKKTQREIQDYCDYYIWKKGIII